MTDIERRLWQRLRDKQLDGHRFRRQVVIGPYIVDFLCLETRLAIEVDGGQHQEADARDRQRDGFLVGQGYRVLRFWNNEVDENMDGVLTRVLEALAAPHPNPPPQAGEGICGGSDEVAVPSGARDGPEAHRGLGWGEQP